MKSSQSISIIDIYLSYIFQKFNFQIYYNQLLIFTFMDKHSKPGTPQNIPSKILIINWVRSLFPDVSPHLKIQDFGEGVIYARILNHFYGNPAHTKIVWHPKNQYDYINNLKHVQTALSQLSIVIPLNVNKIAKCKFLQNWALINSFYRHFHQTEQHNVSHEDHSVSSHGNQNNNIGLAHKRPQRMMSNFNTEVQMRGNSRQDQHNMIPHQSYSQPKEKDYVNSNMKLNMIAQNSLQITSYLKQNTNPQNTSPNKGKWSVGSQMLHNNQTVVIDRIKEILLKGSHDTQKVRQIKMLLGMPTQEEQIIKIEDDENGMVIYGNSEASKAEKQMKEQTSKENQDEFKKESVQKISSKQSKKPFKI